MTAVNVVPVVGTPLAYGLGFLMLILIAFAWEWVAPLVMVAIIGGQYAGIRSYPWIPAILWRAPWIFVALLALLRSGRLLLFP